MTVLTASAADRPNVIILITDDQGLGDLSSHGHPILETLAFENEWHRPNHSTFNSFACGKSLNSKTVPSVRKASGDRSQFDHTSHQSC